MFRVIGNSPAALEGYLGLSQALSRGQLDAKTRARIAMTVAELNRCDYCLSAHTYLGTNVAKLDAAELTANREGSSSDARSAAALRFACKLVTERGRVSAADVDALAAAGYSAAEVIEIVLHVALNTLTNYVNVAMATEVDFPVVAHRAA
jgi:AhpD family alkylhydroperoxidase